MPDLYEYITATGVVVPDTSTVKTSVELEYKTVYGSDFVIDSSTEQGRQIDAEVTARIAVLRNNATIANQINPNYAEGVFLDAVYAIADGERDQEERSTATCTLGGVSGTIILAGSKAQDDKGNQWELANNATIPVSGSIDASFFSVEYGPIQAATGEINQIIDGTLGWETITNSVAAVPGKNQQSDISTRRQRKLELGKNANSNTFAIIAAISAVENVSSLTFRENFESVEKIIDNVTLKKHSTYVCVDGGINQDIAEAYYDARSGGSGFNGAVIVNVTDPDSGQVIPVQFDRPTDKPKVVRVTVKSSSDQRDAIKQAVVDYANGLIDGEEGFIVGGNVSPFEIAAAVNATVTNVFVAKCEVAESAPVPAYTTDTIETEIFEKASITTDDVTVMTL